MDPDAKFLQDEFEEEEQEEEEEPDETEDQVGFQQMWRVQMKYLRVESFSPSVPCGTSEQSDPSCSLTYFNHFNHFQQISWSRQEDQDPDVPEEFMIDPEGLDVIVVGPCWTLTCSLDMP